MAELFRCPVCCNLSHKVFVHGHGQCLNCGTNIDECCSGENCNNPEEQDEENSETNNELR